MEGLKCAFYFYPSMQFIYCLKYKCVRTSRIFYFCKLLPLSESLCHCYCFHGHVVTGEVVFLWQQRQFQYSPFFQTKPCRTVACNHFVAAGLKVSSVFNLVCHLTFWVCFTLWFPIYIIILCHTLVKWFHFDRWKYLQRRFNYIFCLSDNAILFDLIYL